MKLIVNKKIEISHNMESILQSYQDMLKKYDVVVTEDTVKDTKVLMANINKDKKDFTDKCKLVLSEIEAPIKEFKLKKKEIESLFDESRLRLSSQVQNFEILKLDQISDCIIKTKVDMCNEKGIDQSLVSVEDLIKLSAVTTTNKPTKATITAIENKISVAESIIIKQQQEIKEKALRDEQIRLEAIQQERERVEKKRLADIERSRIESEKEQEQEQEKAKVVDTVVTNLFKGPVSIDNGNTIHKFIIELDVAAPSTIVRNQVHEMTYKSLTKLGLTDFRIVGYAKI